MIQLLRLISTRGMRELMIRQILTNIIPPITSRLFPDEAVSTIHGMPKQNKTSNMLLPIELASAISPYPETTSKPYLHWIVCWEIHEIHWVTQHWVRLQQTAGFNGTDFFVSKSLIVTLKRSATIITKNKFRLHLFTRCKQDSVYLAFKGARVYHM